MIRTVALVLAGGRVDELSVLTLHRPKSALFFGGLYRVIDFPLSNLMNSGIERVGILSQYRSASLIDHIGVGASWDFVGRDRGVTMLPPQRATAESDWYRGTSDAVYQNLEFLADNRSELVMVLSGDHVYPFDYQKIIDFHDENDADVTVAFVKVPAADAGRFGVGRIDAPEDAIGGRLTEYVEKPGSTEHRWASMTVYLFRRDVLFDAVTDQSRNQSSWEFGRDILPKLVADRKVYGYRHRGYWSYSRTIDEYYRSNFDFLSERPALGFHEWNIRTNLDNKRLRDRPPAIVAPGGRIRDGRITFGCRIEGDVERSILFPGVVIGKGAVVRDSILFPDVIVEPGATVDRVIADEKARIGRGAAVGQGEDLTPNHAFPDLLATGITLLGKETTVPGDVKIGRNCIVPPFLTGDELGDREYPSGVLLT